MTTPTDRLNTALADRYRTERHLGEGGMATVYLCDDRRRAALAGRSRIERQDVGKDVILVS